MDKVFDYKKEYKDLYNPKTTPSDIQIPVMKFITITGSGDPNGEEFHKAVGILYGLSYCIKMSKKKDKQPADYFEYVVPPLEGIWSVTDGVFSFIERDNWIWRILIRQPEFVSDEFFSWACSEYLRKEKNADLSNVRLETLEEGLCVQIMHIGPFSTEPESVVKLEEYMKINGYRITDKGLHHEIYLSDPRKSAPEKMKTIIRYPVIKI